MSLQLQAAAKDEAKLKLMKERAAIRDQKLKNPRWHAIGIDTKSLDEQLNEKKKRELELKQVDKFELLKMQEMDRILEEVAREEKLRRDEQMEKLKEEWSKAGEEASIRNSQVIEPIDPESCGASALQSFVGEDSNWTDRTKAQKGQMRRWIQEHTAEKAYRQQKEREDEYTYSQYVAAVDDILGANQREQAETRRRIKTEIARENKERAEEINLKKVNERRTNLEMDEKEISSTLSLNLMVEDVSRAVVNERGKVAKRDEFRGFTTEQRQKIHNQNLLDLQKHRDMERESKLKEAELDNHFLLANRDLERAVSEDQLRKEQEKRIYMAQLKEQMDEQVARKVASKADRFGYIDPEKSMLAKFTGRY